MPLSPSVTNGYRADIDGIRSLAVLSVIIFHLNPSWLPGGFLGVDVFFVVSGYLITGIILRENHLQTFTFSNFYTRRVKRIFPALFVVLALSAATGTFLLHPETYVNFIKSAKYASAQLANFFFARQVDYFDEGFTEQPLLHLWTLGVEEQFYLFWPLLIVFLFWLFRPGTCKNTSSAGNRLVDFLNRRLHIPSSGGENTDRMIAMVFGGLSLVSFIACYILAQTSHNLAFYMFYTRAWEFCLGGFVALRVVHAPASRTANNVISLCGLLLLCISFIIVHQQFLNVSFLRAGVILPCIGTALLIHADNRTGLANRLLATPLPVFIGRISYSLYLYHWPVIIFTRSFQNGNELNVFTSIAIFSTSLLLATISYYLVEQPARKSKMAARSVLTAAAVVIIVAAAGFKTLEAHDTASWRIRQYTDGKRGNYSAVPEVCETKYADPVKYIECKASRLEDPPYVALIGDSHTVHFLNSTVSWAKKSGYNVLYYSAAGCPLLLGDVRFGNNNFANWEERCQLYLPFFESEIVNNPKIEHVFLAQRFELYHSLNGVFVDKQTTYYFKDPSGRKIKDHQSYYRDKLAYTVEAIEKTGKNVTILKQIPLFPGNQDCEWEPRLKKWLVGENICSYNIDFIKKWQQPSIDFIDDFIMTHHLNSFDPIPYFDQPRKRDRNLYENVDHLNGNGCHYLVPHFVKDMSNIFPK